MIEQVEKQVQTMIRITLKLGDDVILEPGSDLINEIGLDSLEAFEAIATLHELLGVRIPDDMDPRSFTTISTIARNLVQHYDAEVVSEFTRIDMKARLAEMNGELDLDPA